MLKGKRHLVTGGAGLIGSHVTDLLVKEGASEVVIVDNFTRGRRENLAWAMAHGNVTLVEGDIVDAKLMNAATRGIDTVFHLAAIRITQCAEDPRLAHDVLATGSFNVLDAAVKNKVRKMIAASSASVYGLAEEFPTTERHHPYNNNTLYGAGKIYLEGMLRSFHAMYGLDYLVTRAFNVYGPRMDIYGVYTEVMIRWMERIAAGKPPLILGDGTQTMDFIYVKDVADAYLLAAKSSATDEALNLASGVETSLNDLAHAMLTVMGSTLDIEHGPERKVNPVRRRLADVSRTERLTGFRAHVSLDQGLRELVDWWRGSKSSP